MFRIFLLADLPTAVVWWSIIMSPKQGFGESRWSRGTAKGWLAFSLIDMFADCRESAGKFPCKTTGMLCCCDPLMVLMVLNEMMRHSLSDSRFLTGFFLCVTPVVATADLYTTGAASLEWKVDSADEIYLATIVEDDGVKGGKRFQPVKTLKSERPLEPFPHDTVNQCRLREVFRPQFPISVLGTKWLLFVRGQKDQARVSGAVHLSHPLAHWWTAAIRAQGRGDQRVLTSGAAILDAVMIRILEDHALPHDCDPDLTDLLVQHRQDGRIPLSSWIGGKVLEVDVRIWDDANGDAPDFDTFVTQLLVPESLQTLDSKHVESRKTLPVSATHGFPETLLARLGSDLPQNDSREFFGSWKTQREKDELTITLQPRGTMLFHLKSKDGNDLPPVTSDSGKRFGAGYWQVNDGMLLLQATHFIDERGGEPLSWRQHFFTLVRDKLQDHPTNQIVLADGTRFDRITDSLKVHDHPHQNHSWYLVSEGWGKHRVSVWMEVTASQSRKEPSVPLGDLFFWREEKRNARPEQLRVPKPPDTIQIKWGEDGAIPKAVLLRAGDTLEIAANDPGGLQDHNIYVEWFRNDYRGFRDPLEKPLLYRRTISESEPLVLTMKCNFHEHRRGYLLVTKDGFASVTDQRGKTSIQNWPIGEQWVRFWHPKYDLRGSEFWFNGVRAEVRGSRVRLNLGTDPLILRIVGENFSAQE